MEAALQAAGIDLRDLERFDGLDVELCEALALGFLAGSVAYDQRVRKADDPTSFVMDRELVVQGAEGESTRPAGSPTADGARSRAQRQASAGPVGAA